MGILGDIKGGLNKGLGKLEDGWHQGEKLVGEGIDWGAHRVGDGLDMVGLHDAAHAVDHWGDEVASDLGATPGEQQLGESDHPNDLVHGNPHNIQQTAKHLKDFFTAFDKVGTGMKKVDTSGWKGMGGDAFREKFGAHPVKWLHAADACETAGGALETYAHTVKWAQDEAKAAIELYKKGKKASEDAIKAYNKRIDAYNAKVKENQDPGPVPEPFHDPGREDIKAAREKLAAARKQRNTAAAEARDKVKAALAHAPAEPPPLSRFGHDLTDGYEAVNLELTHVAGGVVKGTAGLVNFVRGLDPMDPYNLTHPAEYLQGVSTTLSGLVSTAAHPERALKAMVDGFEKDPSEFAGRLIPELLGTKGAGLARGALARGIEEGAAEQAAAGASKWSKLARSTKHVKEEAIHFDSVKGRKARKFLDEEYPWLKDVNNTGKPGYVDNCSHNVVAVDRRLDGIEVSAAPKLSPDHVPPEQLGLHNYPKGHYNMVNNYDDIVRDLKARGEGSRSVVYISRPNGTAHVFNAVNTRHGVVFLDGQSGQLGMLEKNVSSIGHIPYRNGVLK
ncbi:putative T7SS-secreted protein [Streptomyces orinoci]|uniref:T7SS-secreted protein n=1 Tax=Streptomyces orinoci TaxID=67339 RepID=A0ABV3JZ89_STRON|nr:toxin glutamine deamidase domain-containing protein [Streptomyces orinoci]